VPYSGDLLAGDAQVEERGSAPTSSTTIANRNIIIVAVGARE